VLPAIDCTGWLSQTGRMTGLEPLAAWWGYADGDPRLVGALVVLVAIAAAAFLARRAVSRYRARPRR
jgi:hypothetical protein